MKEKKSAKSVKLPKKQPRFGGVNSKYKKIREDFPNLLRSNMGLVYKSCEMAGIDSATYYHWRRDPEFKKRCDEALQLTGDFVESKLYQLIDAGNSASTIFYCKTKLKNRGYIERVEQENTSFTHEEWLKKLEDLK